MPAAPAPALVARLRRAGCVYAEEEAALLVEAARSPAELEQLVRQRAEEGLPLEQVLGWAEFCGLRVPLRRGVFVPRRRTELLARAAVEVTPPGAVVVELCCGAGAISLVLAAAHPDLDLHASDLDPVAVACAAANLGRRATVTGGDLYAALPARLRGRVEVLVANAPYVPTGAIGWMPPEARDHEPLVALDGGPDGLDVLRRVVEAAPAWLAPGGRLLFECSEAQVEAALAAVVAAGLTATVLHDEDREATAVLAVRPEVSPG